MKSIVSNTAIILLAIGISAYALAFMIPEMKFGLLNSKSPELLNNMVWRVGLFCHVLFGVLALLSGSTQFISNLRSKYIGLHRWLGKIYVVSVMISGIAGLCIALSATGGILCTLGFSTLALLWLITTARAYIFIKKKEIKTHRNWMIAIL